MTREVNKILELVDVCLYILFALEVAVRFKLHKHNGSLILWAEYQYEFLHELAPGHDAHLS
jgi:hypothetical protein